MLMRPDAQQIQTRLRVLSSALRDQGITVLHQNSERRFDLVENLPDVWPSGDMLGQLDADVIPAAFLDSFNQAHEHSRSTGNAQSIEFDLAVGNSRRQLQARLSSDVTGVTTIITDVTEERGREAAMIALLREVSHRSKNLLAIVQSVAMQTALHSGDIEDFLPKFRGRLHALSSTQDLVTESNWRGTFLQTLVTSQLTRVGHAALANMRITGDNPLLGPNASLHIGLAIHELGANAVLHGALSEGNAGNVWVDAHLAHRPGQRPDLIIEWQETGIDASRARNEPRFGTLVLERIVPLSVGGTGRLTITGDSLRYSLTVPSDQFEV